MTDHDLQALREAFVERCRKLWQQGVGPDGWEKDMSTFEQWAAERYPDPWVTGPSGRQYRLYADPATKFTFLESKGPLDSIWTSVIRPEDVPTVAQLLATQEGK